jgi:hypothetical protein
MKERDHARMKDMKTIFNFDIKFKKRGISFSATTGIIRDRFVVRFGVWRIRSIMHNSKKEWGTNWWRFLTIKLWRKAVK